MYTERPHARASVLRRPKKIAEQSNLLGVMVDRVTSAQVVDHVADHARDQCGGTVFSVNLDTLRQAHQRPEIHDLLSRADVRIADGMPIIWAGTAAGVPFPERVAGSALVPQLAARAAVDGLSIYLLGGNEGTAEGAGKVLQGRYPALRVAGTDCPPFGFEQSPEQLEAIAERLRSANPAIVFVGLGFPKQEHLIEHLRSACPSAWFVSCGITFSFIVGEVRRAPTWMQRSGLEWLHRLSQEPSRLFRRYFLHDLPFLLTLLREASRRR